MPLRMPQNLFASSRPEAGAIALTVELQAERAFALGRAGRELEAALEALSTAGTADPARAQRVKAAADAAWRYFVQREACGLIDQDRPIEDYAIPGEVLARVGASDRAERWPWNRRGRPVPAKAQRDWNVVVTVYNGGGRLARRGLRKLGRLKRSGHFNVRLMTAKDPAGLLDELERRADAEPALIDAISRVAPAQAGFDFQGAEDFERRFRGAAAAWLERLAGKSFHVRLHRRGDGFDGTQSEEARLGAILMAELGRRGLAARVEFKDPDFVLAIDAVDGRAGIGLWTREDLRCHRFLRPD